MSVYTNIPLQQGYPTVLLQERLAVIDRSACENDSLQEKDVFFTQRKIE